MRITIQRVDADGTVTEGTARLTGYTVGDFRDLHGAPLPLPPGASYLVRLHRIGTPEMPEGD